MQVFFVCRNCALEPAQPEWAMNLLVVRRRPPDEIESMLCWRARVVVVFAHGHHTDDADLAKNAMQLSGEAQLHSPDGGGRGGNSPRRNGAD